MANKYLNLTGLTELVKQINGKYATKDWCWRWSKDKLDWGISNGYIEFKKVRMSFDDYKKKIENVFILKNIIKK